MFVMIFTGILLFFAIIGLLYGLVRGLKKSAVRLGVVILAAFLAVALATGISGAILHSPISEADLSSVGLPAETIASLPENASINDVLVAVLTENEEIAQLTETVPTLMQFVLLAPQAIFAEVLFILLFFAAKFLLWIPQTILTAIFLRTKGKKKQRMLGGLVGAVQGVFIACVVMVPVFGSMSLVDTAVTAANNIPAEDRTEMLAQIVAFDEEVYAPLKSDPAYQILAGIGVDKACTSVFYTLSSATDKDGNTVCFFSDLNSTIPVIVQVSQLGDVDFENLTADDIETIRTLAASCADSPLLASTLSEAISGVADALRDGGSFMGMTLPEDLDEGTAAFLNDVLDTLAEVDQDMIVSDLPEIVDFVAVFVEYDVMGSLDGEGDLTALIKNKDFTTALLSAMTKSDILSPIAVSAVNNFGVNMIADTLGVPKNADEAYTNMVDSVVNELGKYSDLDVSAFLNNKKNDADKAVASVASILKSYTKNLSDEEAIATAKDLVKTFCTVDATAPEHDTVREKLTNKETAPEALKVEKYEPACVMRDDLKMMDKEVFKNMSEEEIVAEIENLTQIIEVAVDIVDKIASDENATSTPIDVLPDVGKLLNNMDNSALLSNSASGVVQHLLDADEVKEVIPEKALNVMKEKVEEKSIDYEATFSTIHATFELVESLNKQPESKPETPETPENPEQPEGPDVPETPDTPDVPETPDTPEEDADKLLRAIQNLFTSMDATTALILKETVDSSFLVNIGLPEDVADIAEVIFGTFFDEVVNVSDSDDLDYAKEGEAIKTIMNFVTTCKDGTTPIEEVVNKNVIDKILQSRVITNTLINVAHNDVIQNEIASSISEEDRATVSAIIDEYVAEFELDGEVVDNCLDAIRLVLGIKTPANA